MRVIDIPEEFLPTNYLHSFVGATTEQTREMEHFV